MAHTSIALAGSHTSVTPAGAGSVVWNLEVLVMRPVDGTFFGDEKGRRTGAVIRVGEGRCAADRHGIGRRPGCREGDGEGPEPALGYFHVIAHALKDRKVNHPRPE